ncbi:MAG: hypothetical protein IJS42_05970 [Synergistaceae bacterium]|nr:hypothetical protein [Synergistaceae bacterium]
MPDNEHDVLKSPEQLDNYIHVTSYGVWLVLSSIMILLLGFTFWIFTGEIETKEHEIISPLSFILK